MMEDFEDQLRGALRRQDPSAGFTERVIAKTKPAKPTTRRPIWTFAAIAAALVVMIGVNQEVQERRAETARQQAVLALRITAEKLNAVRGKVLRHEVRINETENQ
jgi:hypothetical protein